MSAYLTAVFTTRDGWCKSMALPGHLGYNPPPYYRLTFSPRVRWTKGENLDKPVDLDIREFKLVRTDIYRVGVHSEIRAYYEEYP